MRHGFPEFWFGWRHQIAPLADAGFRMLVPDQRGYGLSDKPEAVTAYELDTPSLWACRGGGKPATPNAEPHRWFLSEIRPTRTKKPRRSGREVPSGGNI